MNQLIAAAASVAFMAAPTTVSAQQAARSAAPAAVAPAGEHVGGSQIEGSGWVLPVVGVVALILLIILLTDNHHHHNDLPQSP